MLSAVSLVHSALSKAFSASQLTLSALPEVLSAVSLVRSALSKALSAVPKMLSASGTE